ncbi:MAG TPA: zinc ribbon domain-containing protein, partial [Dehalococcoidia bacterium]|jgi:putative FmdB family regulatory protein|nr:zinc ribbon domain-containing protein [Dehalococcoidia bacterium]
VPIYEFRCKKNHDFELMQSLSKRTATAKCPTCGGRAARQLSAFAIVGGTDASSDFGDFGDLEGMSDMGDMGGMPPGMPGTPDMGGGGLGF